MLQQVYSLKAKQVQEQQTKPRYCSTHKNMRMRAMYSRKPRSEGQNWATIGYVCILCKKPEINYDKLTGMAE